ncbi:MAG: hypothetical protein Q8R00_01295 [Candidatus Nanoarchaeia archaeon]|nr:hypothetical protein [Candidatus Nanoarchaeia archaeon]
MPENLVNALKNINKKTVKKHVRVVKDKLFLREDHFDFYKMLYKGELSRLNYKVNSSWDNILNSRGEVQYLLEPKLFWTGYVLSGDYNLGNLPMSEGIVLPARDRLFAGDPLFEGHKNLKVLGDLETTAILGVGDEYQLPKTTFEVFMKVFRNRRGYENAPKREGLKNFYRLFADSETVQTKEDYVLRTLSDWRFKWSFIIKSNEIIGVSKEVQKKDRKKNASA